MLLISWSPLVSICRRCRQGRGERSWRPAASAANKESRRGEERRRRVYGCAPDHWCVHRPLAATPSGLDLAAPARLIAACYPTGPASRIQPPSNTRSPLTNPVDLNQVLTISVLKCWTLGNRFPLETWCASSIHNDFEIQPYLEGISRTFASNFYYLLKT